MKFFISKEHRLELDASLMQNAICIKFNNSQIVIKYLKYS